MPDVGLLSSTEPVSPKSRMIIKYSVEIDGLPVYTETYDVKKLEGELKHDARATERNWLRRMRCIVCCRKRSGFSACLTRCLTDGKCCREGHEECGDVENGT